MIYEFLLPNVDFGVADEVSEALPGQGIVLDQSVFRDKISFEIQGRWWVLRKMVDHQGTPTPADVVYRSMLAAGLSPRTPPATSYCCLQVESEGLPEIEARETADDICWILELPLGQKVSWVELGHRTDGGYQMVNQRAVQVATQPQGSAPIRNWGDGKLRQFVQNAYPIYKEDPTWWRVTLDWLAFAYGSSVIQVTGLICSMLLERIPRFLLRKVAFPAQIDENLGDKIGKGTLGRATSAKEVNAFFRGIAKDWKDERGEAILDVVLGWNAEPSYAAKNREAFATLGMQPPSGKILENRHSLAHNGELKSNGLEPSDYFKQVLQVVTAVLLGALGYRGKFFVLGVGEAQV